MLAVGELLEIGLILLLQLRIRFLFIIVAFWDLFVLVWNAGHRRDQLVPFRLFVGWLVMPWTHVLNGFLIKNDTVTNCSAQAKRLIVLFEPAILPRVVDLLVIRGLL